MPVIPNAPLHATVLAIAETRRRPHRRPVTPAAATSPGRTSAIPHRKGQAGMTASAARNEQLRRYVENRHIEHIPAGARHGKPWQQFVFWFGGNVNVFNVVLGGVTVVDRPDLLVGADRHRASAR